MYYTSRKKNKRVDTLSKGCDYMKIKEIFNYDILKINKDETLFANYVEINVVIIIINDQNEKFLIKKGKL